MSEEKDNIPYGYERITYSRCGDSEVLEILRPAADNVEFPKQKDIKK